MAKARFTITRSILVEGALMEFDEVLRVLDSINEAIPVGNLFNPHPHPLAAALNKPGLYSIFIDDRERLPCEFAGYMANKSTSMVYLG